MYDVHLGLIGKRIVDFLLMLIELFFRYAESLRAKRDRKSAISHQRGQFDPSGRRGRPTNHFCTGSYANECLTTFSLTVFTQSNFVSGLWSRSRDVPTFCLGLNSRKIVNVLVSGGTPLGLGHLRHAQDKFSAKLCRPQYAV